MSFGQQKGSLVKGNSTSLISRGKSTSDLANKGRGTLRGMTDPSALLVKKRKIKGDTKESQKILEAALKGETKIIQKINEDKKKKFDPNTHDLGDGATALHISLLAAKDDFAFQWIKDVAKVEVNASSKTGETALHIAVLRDIPDMVNLLLAKGANPVAVDSHSITPLHLAIYNHNDKLFNTLLEKIPITDKAPIDSYVRKGNTLLLEASISGNGKAIRGLIRVGANLNYQNEGGNTALHLAALEGHTSSATALMGFKPDVGIQNKSSRTAADLAREFQRPDFAKILENVHSGGMTAQDFGKRSIGSEGAFTSQDDFVSRAPVFKGRIVTDLPPPDWSTSNLKDKSKLTFKSKNNIQNVPPPSGLSEPPPPELPLESPSFSAPFDLPPPPPSNSETSNSETSKQRSDIVPPPMGLVLPPFQSGNSGFDLPPPPPSNSETSNSETSKQRSVVIPPPMDLPPPPSDENNSLPPPPPMELPVESENNDLPDLDISTLDLPPPPDF